MNGKGLAPQFAARRGRFQGNSALVLEDWGSSVQLVVSREGVIQSQRSDMSRTGDPELIDLSRTWKWWRKMGVEDSEVFQLEVLGGEG
jgi:hypothetical protein